MDGECVARVVGGAVRKADETTITTHFYARHHEWVQSWRGDSQDGFFCRFCLSIAYWRDGRVVVEAPAPAHEKEG